MSGTELDAFYRRVTLPLLRRARWRHGLSKEDAWDVVQDAFLLAVTKIDSAKNPQAWIIQVLDHMAANHQRKVTRRMRLTARWGRTDVESRDDSPDGTDDDSSRGE